MLAAMFLLIAAGVMTLFAAGNPLESSPETSLAVSSTAWRRQLIYSAAGLLGMIMINLVNYRWLGSLSYWIYALILTLLAVLLLDKLIDLPFVPIINSSRRWLRLGTQSRFLQVQPSEFCKIAYILALAWYLRFRKNYRKFFGLVGPFALTVLAMILILLEPDLGTVFLMLPILFAMLFVAGAKVKHLLIIILLALSVSPLLWHYMRHNQRMRVSSVLLQNEKIFEKAEQNPKLAKILAGSTQNLKKWQRDEGYQLIHSKLAVASGGLKGYGFRKGPYIKYNSLPERHNDFIFAIIAHQFGLLGCLALLSLYAIIIGCGIEIAWLNTDPFARLVAVGIVAMFAVEVIVNVSMTLGLMPITGLTLPLVSSGGSSLVVSMMAIGLLNNIGRSRPFTVAARSFEYKSN
jgi:cell division protein FtsW (lipid II flippase)